MKWRTYINYSETRKPWLGTIPNHWSVKRIKHTTYVKGRIGWQGLKSDEFIDEGPYLVTGTDFINGRINWESCYHVSEERFNEDPYIQLKEKDLLITKDGTIGKVAVVKDLPGKATLNSGIFVTRPSSSDYISEYLYWVLHSGAFVNFIDFTRTGTTISHLYQNVFVEFSFPIPKIEEQQAIAAFLDCETARIDALIEKKQRQIELLQEKRAALVSHAVTKGLNPNVMMKDSAIEWLGEIPEPWGSSKMKYLVTIVGGGTPAKSEEGFWSGSIPWISPKDMGPMNLFDAQDHITSEAVDNSSTKIIQPGAVLIVVRSGILRRALPVGINRVEVSLNQDMKALIPKKNLLAEFLAYLIKGLPEALLSLWKKTGTTVESLEYELIVATELPLPDIFEQRAIITFLDHETARIDELITKVQRSIDLLYEYRISLITAAVTGKIDVRSEVETLQKERKAPQAFQRAVLAAEIVDRLHREPTFGRVKFQKILYLCEHHLGMDLGGDFRRQAAGPFDNRMLHSVESQLEHQRWFSAKRDRGRIVYIPMENAGGHKKYFDNYWAEYRDGLDWILRLLRPLDTERCEIVATLFAAWNDLIVAGKTFNDEDIVHEVRANWHESKRRFYENRLRKTLHWMRNNGLVPQGRGKATVPTMIYKDGCERE